MGSSHSFSMMVKIICGFNLKLASESCISNPQRSKACLSNHFPFHVQSKFEHGLFLFGCGRRAHTQPVEWLPARGCLGVPLKTCQYRWSLPNPKEPVDQLGVYLLLTVDIAITNLREEELHLDGLWRLYLQVG